MMYLPILNSFFRSIQKRKTSRLWYFPTKISIETGNICNLCCPLCPTNSPEHNEIEKGFMTIDDFKLIFDKVKPFVKTIDLFNWGEPFLNRDFSSMVEYAKKEKPEVRIFVDTNFNLVTDAQIDAIVRYGVDCLKISCDGATQDTYHKYRIGGSINSVIENIKKVLKKKYEINKDTPRIIWKYLVFKHNEHEIEQALHKSRELGIEFEASGMRIDCGKEIFENVEDSVERDKEWIPESGEYNQYKDLSSGKTTCEKPWKTLTVNWDGDVVACGAVYDCRRYKFGNLLEEDFNDIWNGERFVKARKIIAGEEKDESIICHICKENGFQHF